MRTCVVSLALAFAVALEVVFDFVFDFTFAVVVAVVVALDECVFGGLGIRFWVGALILLGLSCC